MNEAAPSHCSTAEKTTVSIQHINHISMVPSYLSLNTYVEASLKKCRGIVLNRRKDRNPLKYLVVIFDRSLRRIALQSEIQPLKHETPVPYHSSCNPASHSLCSFPLHARTMGCVDFTDTCGPSEVGGSVFDPTSYNCSATCELANGVPSTPIGVFHNEIVTELLPTLHGENRKQAWYKTPERIYSISSSASSLSHKHTHLPYPCPLPKYCMYAVFLFVSLEKKIAGSRPRGIKLNATKPYHRT